MGNYLGIHGFIDGKEVICSKYRHMDLTGSSCEVLLALEEKYRECLVAENPTNKDKLQAFVKALEENELVPSFLNNDQEQWIKNLDVEFKENTEYLTTNVIYINPNQIGDGICNSESNIYIDLDTNKVEVEIFWITTVEEFLNERGDMSEEELLKNVTIIDFAENLYFNQTDIEAFNKLWEENEIILSKSSKDDSIVVCES